MDAQTTPTTTSRTRKEENTMTRTYNINGKTITLDDHDAIRALAADELAELLKQTQSMPVEQGDTGPDFPQLQPPTGTGFIIMQPPTATAQPVDYDACPSCGALDPVFTPATDSEPATHSCPECGWEIEYPTESSDR